TALASLRMPTRTSPQRPIPAPQQVQVTRLSFVAGSGTMNLLLPHSRHLRGAFGMARAVHPYFLCARIMRLTRGKSTVIPRPGSIAALATLGVRVSNLDR